MLWCLLNCKKLNFYRVDNTIFISDGYIKRIRKLFVSLLDNFFMTDNKKQDRKQLQFLLLHGMTSFFYYFVKPMGISKAS